MGAGQGRSGLSPHSINPKGARERTPLDCDISDYFLSVPTNGSIRNCLGFSSCWETHPSLVPTHARPVHLLRSVAGGQMGLGLAGVGEGVHPQPFSQLQRRAKQRNQNQMPLRPAKFTSLGWSRGTQASGACTPAWD